MNSFNRKLSVACMALAIAGCHDDDDDNGTGAVPLSTGLQTMQSAGLEREYFIQIPEAASAAPASVGTASASATLPALWPI